MNFKVVCLMGPTASGKTDLSLRLAEDIPCEIISVDSAMVYKNMNIGTAKPTLEQRAKVPHHLIDITDPWNSYSTAKFIQDAMKTIQDIQAKGKVPILVGGTMLYFKGLQEGLSLLPSADEDVRKTLLDEANRVGWLEMHARLALVDPESAQRINPNDPQRIQRALEVFEITGQPLTALLQNKQCQSLSFDFIDIALAPQERTILHERIAQRFKAMMDEGFIAEVEQLHKCERLHINLPAIRSVGYRQAWQYLEGEITLPELHEKGIAATRQLAKRQLTWLRHWKSLQWFDTLRSDVYPKLLSHIRSSIHPHK